MVSPSELIVHCSKAEPISQSASASHLRTRKIGRRFAPLWKVVHKVTRTLLEGDDTGTFMFLALDVRSQVHSIFDRRHGVGKPELAQEVIFFFGGQNERPRNPGPAYGGY